MAKFDFREWFLLKSKKRFEEKTGLKKPKTSVTVPIPNEEKPAKFSLVGMCDHTLSSLVELTKGQLDDVRVSMPKTTTAEGITIALSGEMDPLELAKGLEMVSKEEVEEIKPSTTPPATQPTKNETKVENKNGKVPELSTKGHH